MRIFVSEYLCGGGWPESELPASLMAEGRAMFQAVAADLSKLDGITVVTTRDSRLPAFDVPIGSSFEVHSVRTPEEELKTFRSLLSEVDAALIIAPEMNGILEHRCSLIPPKVRRLNSDDAAIRLCADKIQVFQQCQSLGLPTIDTWQVGERDLVFPCVVKLRDGAGSTGTQLIATRAEWDAWLAEVRAEKWIVQPLTAGIACSMAVFCDGGRVTMNLPMTRQWISPERGFAYEGGAIPFYTSLQEAAQQIVEQWVSRLPGLHGYTGFDFLSDEQNGMISLVEVNPRLTTSYVGYRRLTQEKLARWIIDPGTLPSATFSGGVEFQADGSITENSR